MSEYNCKLIIADIPKDQTYVELTSAPDKKDAFVDVIVPMYKESGVDSIAHCVEYALLEDSARDLCVHIIFDKNDERSGICVTRTWMSVKEKENAH